MATTVDTSPTQDPRVHMANLIQGKPDDFEVVLYIAIVNLVAEYPNWGGAIREEKVPETMLLDLLRIKALNAHFHTDVVSSIILVTVEQKCRELVCDVNLRNRAMKAVQEIVLKNSPNPTSPTNMSQLMTLIMNELKNSIQPDKLVAVQRIMEKNVQKSSPLYLPMTKIFKRVWFHIIKEKIVPEHCKMPDCTKVLVADMEKHSSILGAVVQLNKKVHVVRYNQMISRAVSAITAFHGM